MVPRGGGAGPDHWPGGGAGAFARPVPDLGWSGDRAAGRRNFSLAARRSRQGGWSARGDRTGAAGGSGGRAERRLVGDGRVLGGGASTRYETKAAYVLAVV